jgi:hypothetical protein
VLTEQGLVRIGQVGVLEIFEQEHLKIPCLLFEDEMDIHNF